MMNSFRGWRRRSVRVGSGPILVDVDLPVFTTVKPERIGTEFDQRCEIHLDGPVCSPHTATNRIELLECRIVAMREQLEGPALVRLRDRLEPVLRESLVASTVSHVF